MRDLREVQLEAFHDELQKQGSKWYAEAGKSVANFGKRQLHAFTGWTPHGYNNVRGIEEIGAGAAHARARAASAAKGSAARELADKAVAANVEAQEKGLTSIPGFVQSLVKDPKATLRTGFNQQWHGTTNFDKSMTLGLPLALTGASAVMPDDPNNPHKGRDIGAGIASTAVGMVTGGIPMTTGMLLGEGAVQAGGAVGGLVDKYRKRRAPPTMGTVQPPRAPEEAVGQHVATERVLSPAAAGQLPEGYA